MGRRTGHYHAKMALLQNVAQEHDWTVGKVEGYPWDFECQREDRTVGVSLNQGGTVGSFYLGIAGVGRFHYDGQERMDCALAVLRNRGRRYEIGRQDGEQVIIDHMDRWRDVQPYGGMPLLDDLNLELHSAGRAEKVRTNRIEARRAIGHKLTDGFPPGAAEWLAHRYADTKLDQPMVPAGEARARLWAAADLLNLLGVGDDRNSVMRIIRESCGPVPKDDAPTAAKAAWADHAAAAIVKAVKEME